MNTKVLVLCLIAGVLLVAFVLSRARRRDVNSRAGRLSKLIVQRGDYQIFVGVPFATPKQWAVAARQEEDSLNVQGHGSLRVSDVRAFAVAYARQLLDCELCGLPLPEDLSDSDFLHLGALEPGRAYIQITYGPSATRQRDRHYYATSLKNISTEGIRVRRFAGYRPSEEGWRLSTVTRQFYSAEEFCEWYGLGSSKWIEPGQVVTDPNNYGSPPVLWAYYCESASGQEFIAGGILE
jgi:hypothetical protein